MAQFEQQQLLLLERERLHALINSLPDDVFSVDADGNVVLVNDNVRSSLGIAATDDLHKRLSETESMSEVCAADGRRRRSDESPFIQALRGEVVSGEESVRNLKTGEPRYRQYRVAPVFLQGRVVGALSSVQDITDRKKAEEALRQSEERYAVLFERAPFARALSRLPEGKLVGVNQAFLDLFEFQREERLGRTSVDLDISRRELGRAAVRRSVLERLAGGLGRDPWAAARGARRLARARRRSRTERAGRGPGDGLERLTRRPCLENGGPTQPLLGHHTPAAPRPHLSPSGLHRAPLRRSRQVAIS